MIGLEEEEWEEERRRIGKREDGKDDWKERKIGRREEDENRERNMGENRPGMSIGKEDGKGTEEWEIDGKGTEENRGEEILEGRRGDNMGRERKGIEEEEERGRWE